MKVAILSARSGWHTDELCRALVERGHTASVVPYESLVARIGVRSDLSAMPWGPPPRLRPATARLAEARSAEAAAGPGGSSPSPRSDPPAIVPLFEADAVLARIIPDGSLEQIIFRVDALHWLEDRGIPVMNSARAIERCVDKFYTTALLHDAGVPTPETVVCERAADAITAIRVMLGNGAEAVIIKPLFGSMGHGMVRVSDAELAWRIVRPLERMRSVFYVQRAIDHGGRDIRAFVVGGRVLGAIDRMAPEGDWRTNVARGGAAHPVDLPPAWVELALRAAGVVGAEYAGVDLLPSRDGRVSVLEVNGIPGWEGLQRATGIDVAGAVIEQLAELTAPRPSRSGPHLTESAV